MKKSTKKHSSRRRGEKKSVKFHKARIRHFLFTHGPNQLSGGRIKRRHLANEVIIREIEVVNPKWPKELDGLRIGHVSDFHLGDLLPIDRALGVVALLAEQEPDMVACTGDVVDLHCDDAEPLLRAMADVGAPMGSLLVLGNHDLLDDGGRVAHVAEVAGMVVLRNEAVEITHNGADLLVGGVNWAKTQRLCARNVERVCGDGAHLLLSHNPKSFRRASEMGIPLTLAGHTHGGQIAWRNRPNVNLSLTHRRRAGLFHERGSHLFVTTGVGAWFPLRVNCPPEIVMLTVRRETPEKPADQGG